MCPSWPQRWAVPGRDERWAEVEISSIGSASSSARTARSAPASRRRRPARAHVRRDPSRSGPAASARESGRPLARSPAPRPKAPARGGAPAARRQAQSGLRRLGPWGDVLDHAPAGRCRGGMPKRSHAERKMGIPAAVHRFTTQDVPPAQRRPEGREDRPPRPNLPLTPWNRSMLELRIGQSEA